MQLVERWILARLRKITFFSLDDLNQAIAGLLQQLNHRPFKKMAGSRLELFESLDRPALGPLPLFPYQYADWKKAKVNIDYHVEFERHYYSVPYQLAGKTLDLRVTARTVECLHKGKRVASHRRNYTKGRHTTVAPHMPRSHREYLRWTPQRLLNWAAKTGPACAELARVIMERRAHPQQAFRSILGILRLSETYGPERLEAACQRALDIDSPSFKSVGSILKNGKDKKPLKQSRQQLLPINHHNIRGKSYYAPEQGGPTNADSSHHGQTDHHEANRHGRGPGRADGNERPERPVI